MLGELNNDICVSEFLHDLYATSLDCKVSTNNDINVCITDFDYIIITYLILMILLIFSLPSQIIMKINLLL